MSVFATETTRFSAAIKYEMEPALGYTRESITINDPSATTYQPGDVLGKITASGKYRISLSASSDGSQTPAAVFIADVMGLSGPTAIAAATDTKALAIVRGPVVLADFGLRLGTGITLSAARTAFSALNPPIIIETAV